MFGETNQKKNLIIVCENEWMECGNLLMGLIGQKDDNGENIIGTKDDMVSAAIWTPKEYYNSMSKLSSDAYILFIGSFKEAKEVGKNVRWEFEKYGMHYGWLGRRAVMYVDDNMLKKKEYDEFLKFSKEYQQRFEKASVNFLNTLPGTVKWIGTLFAPIVYPAFIYGLISGGIEHKKIKKQQYTCLTLALYYQGLQRFMDDKIVVENKELTNEKLHSLGFCKIVKKCLVKKEGRVGYLIWDSALVNEISFVDEKIHSIESLYKGWDDHKTEEKFQELSLKYLARN